MAVINWVSIAEHWTTLKNISKPTTIVILIAWYILETRGQPTGWKAPRTWFAVGLVFSLAGDVLLIGSGSRAFDLGLAAFLLAHICYINGFNRPWVPPGRLTVVFVAVLGTYAAVLYSILYSHITGILKVAVAVYAIGLCTMVLSSLETWRRPDWVKAAALLASVGGVIFLSSDSMLAIQQFVRPTSAFDLPVMVTYYLGQFGIIAGVVNHVWHAANADLVDDPAIAQR